MPFKYGPIFRILSVLIVIIAALHALAAEGSNSGAVRSCSSSASRLNVLLESWEHVRVKASSDEIYIRNTQFDEILLRSMRILKCATTGAMSTRIF